jgi:uncharacterized damage-inducible protein DinB
MAKTLQTKELQQLRLSTLKILFAYHDWAMRQVLQLGEKVKVQDLERPSEADVSNIRSIFLDLMLLEHYWQRASGSTPFKKEKLEGVSLKQLTTVYLEIAEARRAWLSSLSGEALFAKNHDSEGSNKDVNLYSVLMYILNEAVHQRILLVNQIRHVWVDVPQIGYLVFVDDVGLVDRMVGDIDTIKFFFSYTDWANNRILSAIQRLGESALYTDTSLGWRSIQTTLMHIYNVDSWWLTNWLEKPSRAADPRQSSKLALSDISALFAQNSKRRDDYLSSIGNEDLSRSVEAFFGEHIATFLLGTTMLDLALHATHHRAEAVGMLKTFGFEVPKVDCITYGKVHND